MKSEATERNAQKHTNREHASAREENTYPEKKAKNTRTQRKRRQTPVRGTERKQDKTKNNREVSEKKNRELKQVHELRPRRGAAPKEEGGEKQKPGTENTSL